MSLTSVKALFIIHKFEVKTLEDSAGYLEVLRPMVESGYLTDYRVLSFGRAFDYYQQKVEKRLEELKVVCQNEPVIIYGAGAHTRQFFKQLKTLNIVALTDRDERFWGTECFGLPVISPEQAHSAARHIVISSRAYEDSILHQLKSTFPNTTCIYGLYQNQGQDQVDTLSYYDEMTKQVDTLSYYDEMTKQVDQALATFNPDLIVYTPTHPSENIGSDYFLKVKQQYPNLKFVNVWWDYDEQAETGSYLDYERDCLRYSDYVIENSNFTRLSKMAKHEPPYQSHHNTDKVHFHPTIFDSTLFHTSSEKRTFDVAIWGSSVGERGDWIECLKKEYGSRFKHFGGVYQGDEPLAAEDYAAQYRLTKIAVNTQTYPFRSQCKGKVRETLCSGAFLLEEDNPETRAFLPESLGVVYFSSKEDLKQKIDYYLEHEDEREAIALAGNKWIQNERNCQYWTAEILCAIGLLFQPERVNEQVVLNAL